MSEKSVTRITVCEPSAITIPSAGDESDESSNPIVGLEIGVQGMHKGADRLLLVPDAVKTGQDGQPAWAVVHVKLIKKKAKELMPPLPPPTPEEATAAAAAVPDPETTAATAGETGGEPPEGGEGAATVEEVSTENAGDNADESTDAADSAAGADAAADASEDALPVPMYALSGSAAIECWLRTLDDTGR
jgi:methyl-accepting chemotaxis protein